MISLGVVDQSTIPTACDSNNRCGLVPASGEYKLHYAGQFDLCARAYVAAVNSYTPWSIVNTFTIDQSNTPLPTASTIELLGMYETIGSGPTPDVKSDVATWQLCSGISGPAPNDPVCSSSRPILHIGINKGRIHGQLYPGVGLGSYNASDGL